MPRYLVERTHPAAWTLARTPGDCEAALSANASEGVTWLHSYVAPDGIRSFCLYEGASPESVRAAAHRSGLPVDRITEVQVLDPHAVQPSPPSPSL